jgi:predicted nucleic acid-binding protein
VKRLQKFTKNSKPREKLVGEIDILIAAITRTNNEELITRDEHFELLIPKSKLQKW